MSPSIHGKNSITWHSNLAKKIPGFWQLTWSTTEAVNDINKMSWDQKCVILSQLIEEVIQTTLGLHSSEVLLAKIKSEKKTTTHL